MTPAGDSAVVDFCGEQIRLDPGRTLTFGRAAELVIDDNPFLHRRLGLLEHRQGSWWLRNTGSRIPLTVNDTTSRSRVILAPGRELALSFPAASVHFSAGRSNYQLEIVLSRASPWDDRVDHRADDEDAGRTVSLSDLPLTVDQRRLIVALAESTLRTGQAAIDLPTNREAARRLGWTITRFNRKLDNVCERLAKVGVSGLRGQAGVLAADRRRRLVEHAVNCGLVDVDDLALLPER